MGVMMQAFYWDCPREENREFAWWNYVREISLDLRASVSPTFGCRPPTKQPISTGRRWDTIRMIITISVNTIKGGL